MKIFNYVLIVVIIGAAGFATYLGKLIFDQRTEIKTRTIKLEDGFSKVATSLEYENVGKIKGMLQDVDQMDSMLKEMNAYSANKQAQIHQLTADLNEAKAEITRLAGELEATQNQLEQTKAEVARLEGVVDEKNAEIVTLNGNVATLEGQVAELEGSIANLKDSLAEKEDEVAALKDEVAALDDENERLLAEIRAKEDPDKSKLDVIGEIVAINRDWNFVVIDIGSEDDLVPGLNALVHRKEAFVGKININTVEEKFAVADILPEWQKLTLKEGDSVFFN